MTDLNLNRLGRNIKECRNKIRMTQQELADAIDTNQQQIARWEGGIDMSISNIYKVGYALKMNDPRRLLDGVEEVDDTLANLLTYIVQATDEELYNADNHPSHEGGVALLPGTSRDGETGCIYFLLDWDGEEILYLEHPTDVEDWNGENVDLTDFYEEIRNAASDKLEELEANRKWYAVIDESGANIWVEQYATLEEALEEAEHLWNRRLTKSDKQGRTVTVGRLADADIGLDLDEVFAEYS